MARRLTAAIAVLVALGCVLTGLIKRDFGLVIVSPFAGLTAYGATSLFFLAVFEIFGTHEE